MSPSSTTTVIPERQYSEFDLTEMRLSWDICGHDVENLFESAGTRDPAAAAEWYGDAIKEPHRAPSIAGCLMAIYGQPRP